MPQQSGPPGLRPLPPQQRPSHTGGQFPPRPHILQRGSALGQPPFPQNQQRPINLQNIGIRPGVSYSRPQTPGSRTPNAYALKFPGSPRPPLGDDTNLDPVEIKSEVHHNAPADEIKTQLPYIKNRITAEMTHISSTEERQRSIDEKQTVEADLRSTNENNHADKSEKKTNHMNKIQEDDVEHSKKNPVKNNDNLSSLQENYLSDFDMKSSLIATNNDRHTEVSKNSVDIMDLNESESLMSNINRNQYSEDHVIYKNSYEPLKAQIKTFGPSEMQTKTFQPLRMQTKAPEVIRKTTDLNLNGMENSLKPG